ncbi:hypothetical protein ACHAP5_009043 [Fusarium lateritium]
MLGGKTGQLQGIWFASQVFAAVLGIQDEDLTMKQNLTAIWCLSPIVASAGTQFSIDLQGGYGSRIQDAVRQAVQVGAHGANLEDSIPSQGLDKGIEGSLYSLDHQTQRLLLACQAASDAGCPDFVFNARCDIFAPGDVSGLDNKTRVQEAVKRGKAYLEAGTTTVFYWRGYDAGVTNDEVGKLVEELDGRVAIRSGQLEMLCRWQSWVQLEWRECALDQVCFR